MSSNRLLPYQFAPGLDASPTRIEQSLLELAKLYDDVPADLVGKRWSPSHLLWGFSPPDRGSVGSPFLQAYNSKPLFLVSTTQGVTNPYRAKSTEVYGIDPESSGNLLTWEVTMLATHPMIIGSFVVMAGTIYGSGAFDRSYSNTWQMSGDPATPAEDFTLQVCISDGWDLENRKKLRQESLTYKMRSDAFAFTPYSPPSYGPLIGAADTTVPALPQVSGQPQLWNGFAVMADALVLVPAGARIVFQWTIPYYADAEASTWGQYPERGNTWNLRALAYNPLH